MKLMKKLFAILLCSGAMSALAETNVTSAAEAAAAKAKEDRIMELLNTGSDPFRFEQGTDGTGSSAVNVGQMDITRISTAISVKGVLALKGNASSALIKVGNSSVQLVQKDDLILMPASAPMRKHGKTVTPVHKVKYLIVKDISKDSIVVAPEHRPQELIKIR